MEKRALLVYGERKEKDNPSFEQDRNRDLNIIQDIIKKEGYDYRLIPISQLDLNLREYEKTKDFFFYFNGHGNETSLGNFSTSLEDVVNSISQLNGEKTIVLDACTLDFTSNYTPKKNTKLIASKKVYPSRSIAISLYDAILARKIPLKNISQKTFEEIKHYGVIVKENSTNQLLNNQDLTQGNLSKECLTKKWRNKNA